MKLKNKKTGEIVDVESLGHADSLKGKFGYQVTLSWKIDEHLDTCKTYDSLAELNAEWEDYEEPKEYWHIDFDGSLMQTSDIKCDKYVFDKLKEIGNYFETKEEAEKAVEKLKAWKRLKDKGFKFVGWYDSVSDNNPDNILFKLDDDAWETSTCDDLDLLFGDEK